MAKKKPAKLPAIAPPSNHKLTKYGVSRYKEPQMCVKVRTSLVSKAGPGIGTVWHFSGTAYVDSPYFHKVKEITSRGVIRFDSGWAIPLKQFMGHVEAGHAILVGAEFKFTRTW